MELGRCTLSLSLSRVLIEHSGITGGTDYRTEKFITNVPVVSPFTVNRVILYSVNEGRRASQAPRAARVRSFLIVIHTWTDRGRHITRASYVRVNPKTESLFRVDWTRNSSTLRRWTSRVSSDSNESSQFLFASLYGQVRLICSCYLLTR